MKISKKAAEFFQDLAKDHDMYPDKAKDVVDSFITEWEMRERIDPMYRTFGDHDEYKATDR